MGRQDILGRLEEIVAYELLFRSHGSLISATIKDSTRALMVGILSLLDRSGPLEYLLRLVEIMEKFEFEKISHSSS